jgi:hypothetical protein
MQWTYDPFTSFFTSNLKTYSGSWQWGNLQGHSKRVLYRTWHMWLICDVCHVLYWWVGGLFVLETNHYYKAYSGCSSCCKLLWTLLIIELLTSKEINFHDIVSRCLLDLDAWSKSEIDVNLNGCYYLACYWRCLKDNFGFLTRCGPVT